MALSPFVRENEMTLNSSAKSFRIHLSGDVLSVSAAVVELTDWSSSRAVDLIDLGGGPEGAILLGVLEPGAGFDWRPAPSSMVCADITISRRNVVEERIECSPI